jgi:hypothetical protein
VQLQLSWQSSQCAPWDWSSTQLVRFAAIDHSQIRGFSTVISSLACRQQLLHLDGVDAVLQQVLRATPGCVVFAWFAAW